MTDEELDQSMEQARHGYHNSQNGEESISEPQSDLLHGLLHDSDSVFNQSTVARSVLASGHSTEHSGFA
jgi:hypothetical protein